ncbi:hypothetical protein BH23BAC1_BH23BAC1_35920 [soil metagenome]
MVNRVALSLFIKNLKNNIQKELLKLNNTYFPVIQILWKELKNNIRYFFFKGTLKNIIKL